MSLDVENEISRLKTFDDAYFNDEPLIPDAQYDDLKKRVQDIAPDHPYFNSVGHEERGGKVDLPYQMGSLDQIYEGDYDKWIKKNNLENEQVLTSEKLDGTSVLLVYECKEGDSLRLKQAFSRGNGIQGADISRHVRKVPSVPKSPDLDTTFLVVRAEAIMEDSKFEKKYSKKYRNARQMVAGSMNRKVTTQEVLNDIDIVAYEIVDMADATELLGEEDTKKSRFNLLSDAGFKIAYHEVDDALAHSDASLAETLDRFRESSKYTIDGLVITANDYLNLDSNRKSSSLNPEHSVKFKVLSEDSIVDTTVVNVHWKLSKSNFWKPRVEIEPVDLFGTTVTFATGFNGKFINDKKIGPGAKIKITKAGEVIPYIVDVIEPSKTVSEPESGWEWDDLGVEWKAPQGSSEPVIMQLVHFFKTIGVEYLQETSIRKMLDFYDLENESFTSMAEELIGFVDEEWKRVLGENGMKIFLSLHKKLTSIKREQLLGATPFFGRGFGVRKAKKIMDVMSLDEFLSSSVNDIENIEGFAQTSQTVIDGIPEFKDFYNRIEEYVSFEEVEKTDTLDGEVIVMTGFRDKEIKEFIENSGGRVSSAVSGKTTMVIAADVNSNSGKIKKAKENGIPVISANDFRHEYIH